MTASHRVKASSLNFFCNIAAAKSLLSHEINLSTLRHNNEVSLVCSKYN